ncbi:MAG: STAS domain-containing protein [Gammaproteobacteria bacterium]|nr:STAS domain-containing protein [Gammaproteobacteria bacterium]
MNECRIEKDQDDFKIFGLINFETAAQLYKKGTELFVTTEEVRLDFAKVAFVDSSAIALLFNWLRFAKQKGKSFEFVNLPAQLLEIANVCEVMPFLEQYMCNTTKIK